MLTPISKEELQIIIKSFEDLISNCSPILQGDDLKRLEAAFDLSFDVHKDLRRESGEPYIMHPLAVAHIVFDDLGLGVNTIISALLHEVPGKSDISIEALQESFGEDVSTIVASFRKICGLTTKSDKAQVENFRKLILSISEDIRVILLKLADRLHNMRTLQFKKAASQLRIAQETFFLYSPLAHRLGLNYIKSELEDLSLQYLQPKAFSFIKQKIDETALQRNQFISEFVQPIKAELEKTGLSFEIKSRTKSITSIWNKMQKQKVDFDEVYDLFAVRIVLNSSQENEKPDCWRVYSVVADIYQPNPTRLRDWVTTPKANGYSSLHTTVMSKQGKWVEVQIRSQAMHEVAEKGLAAHWKYKGEKSEGIETWLKNVRDLLETSKSGEAELLENFKLNLYEKEIFVFTPKGDLKKLPKGATVLDFAFQIHTNIGAKCVSAKVNYKLVPLRHVLQNGDQVEIITAKNQKPTSDWLNYVVTSNARARIKKILNEEKFILAEQGKEILQRKLKNWKLSLTDKKINELILLHKLRNAVDFYYLIATGKIDVFDVKSFLLDENGTTENQQEKTKNAVQAPKSKTQDEGFSIGESNIDNINFSLSPCCNPLQGDDVFGFITIGKGITIHRSNCPNAKSLLEKFEYRMVKINWKKTELKEDFQSEIVISGNDRVGILNEISKVISTDLKVNMKSISIKSDAGIFTGYITVVVPTTKNLDILMNKLSKIKGVLEVKRV
ncbi:MAG: RelA/SpoT family protein [Bacteroidota bacterium]